MKYANKKDVITKNGHVMFPEDIAKELNRKSFLENEITSYADLEKEIISLKDRLKNCLNHDSLIATRSELDKKDAAIKELAEAYSEAIIAIEAMIGESDETREADILIKKHLGG